MPLPKIKDDNDDNDLCNDDGMPSATDHPMYTDLTGN